MNPLAIRGRAAAAELRDDDLVARALQQNDKVHAGLGIMVLDVAAGEKDDLFDARLPPRAACSANIRRKLFGA